MHIHFMYSTCSECIKFYWRFDSLFLYYTQNLVYGESYNAYYETIWLIYENLSWGHAATEKDSSA